MGLWGRKKTVLVDMDGTIADFNKAALARLAARTPDGAVPREDECVRFPLADNFEDADMKARLAAIYNEPGFFAGLEPIAGALDALAEMRAHPRVAGVFLCTAPLARSPHCAAEKIAWVAEHLGREWVDRIVLTRDKSLVRGDMLIDDAPEAKAAHFSPAWEHVYFGAPHNAGLRTAPGAGFRRRVVRWSERKVVLHERPRARGEWRGAAVALAVATSVAVAFAIQRRC